MNKIFVVGPYVGYARWFKGFSHTDNLEEADVVLFTGGEDINPALYGQKPIPETWFSEKRDEFELEMFSRVKSHQLCVGICRGNQLACALYGGILAQDVSAHWIGGTHKIRKIECSKPGFEDLPELMNIPSLHHQMTYPYDMPETDYTVLYVSDENRSSYYLPLTDEQVEKMQKYGEPEVTLYHKPYMPIFLGIQGHPEMMPMKSEEIYVFNQLVHKLL